MTRAGFVSSSLSSSAQSKNERTMLLTFARVAAERLPQRRAIAENADLTARLFENANAAAGAERPATQPASIEQRLARAGGAIPLDWLWPDVPPAEWQQSVRAIAGATKDVLAGKQAMLSGRAEALSVAGYTSGMGPLLGWWIDKGDLCETCRFRPKC